MERKKFFLKTRNPKFAPKHFDSGRRENQALRVKITLLAGQFAPLYAWTASASLLLKGKRQNEREAMKILHPKPGGWGFSFIDLLLVLVLIILLVGFLLPPLDGHGAKNKAKRISCVNTLKQVGLAFQYWAEEHGGKFPMAVSTNQGGSMEYNESGQVFRHFISISDQLGMAKTLVCPADPSRQKAADWTQMLSNSNISYFVGLDAQPNERTSILSGDRNITGGVRQATLMLLAKTNLAGWTKEIHQNAGNIGLADGTVQQLNTDLLRKRIQAIPQPIRLAIP